jgi:hypothetical protein
MSQSNQNFHVSVNNTLCVITPRIPNSLRQDLMSQNSRTEHCYAFRLLNPMTSRPAETLALVSQCVSYLALQCFCCLTILGLAVDLSLIQHCTDSLGDLNKRWQFGAKRVGLTPRQRIYLLIYFLFLVYVKDSVSRSDYIAFNVRMMSE